MAERAALLEDARPTWADLIEELDRGPRLGGGQATAVIAEVGRDGFIGASAGDSQAWLVGSDGLHVLTGSQVRKPLVGAGAAHLTAALHALVGLVRLPGGELHDDVAIVLCRAAR